MYRSCLLCLAVLNVVCTGVASAQNAADPPLRPHAKAPVYQLSNLRTANDTPFGDLAFDYSRQGDNQVLSGIVLVTRNAQGRQSNGTLFLSALSKQQGTLQLRTLGGGVAGGLELWLELHQFIGGKTLRQKISNSVTLGNISQTTEPREWTAEETKAFESWEKSTTPPPPPPAGFVVVSTEAALLPGMPVLAGWMGEWKKAEVIEARKDGNVTVKYPEYSSFLIARPRNWLAIESKTLDAGRVNPKQFVPSVKVLPGGTTPIDPDLEAVTATTPLVPGAPLKAEWGSRWNDVTVLEVLDNDRVRIHWDKFGKAWDDDKDRSSLMISKSTLAALKKPDAKEQFAKRVEQTSSSFGGRPGSSFASPARDANLKRYPIRSPIPGNAVRVTDETPLEEGTKLGANWGNRWENVTVLAVHEDGSVKIHWDQYGSAWDGDMARDCLVIDKKVLKKLESKTGASDASSGKKPASGAYRVLLLGYGTRKLAVTKVVAELTGLELKDALELVGELPVTLKQGLTKQDADELKKQLEASGGVVKVEGP